MKSLWIVLASIATLLPGCLEAQAAPGDLRVHQIDGTVVTGSLIELTPSFVRLMDQGVVIDIERSRIRAVERSLGKRGSFAKNFIVSIGAGALLVGGLASLSCDCSAGDYGFGPGDRRSWFAVGAMVGGIIAVPIGVIAGIASQRDPWETIALPPPVDVALLVGSTHGGGVGVTVRLPIGQAGRGAMQ